MANYLKRQEAINKLVNDDIDSVITGHQDGDNSYLVSLFLYGLKGYDDFTNDELANELSERFDFDEFKVIN